MHVEVNSGYSVLNERNFLAHSILQNSLFSLSGLLQTKQNLILDMRF